MSVATPTGARPRRPLRADARRNRQRLLDVALDAFVEQGIGASLDDIARRAGVGIGTLYRHFPTREDLIGALIRDGVDELCARSDQLLDADDPLHALARWLRALVDHAARFSGLAATIARAGAAAPHHSAPHDHVASTADAARDHADAGTGTVRDHVDGGTGVDAACHAPGQAGADVEVDASGGHGGAGADVGVEAPGGHGGAGADVQGHGPGEHGDALAEACARVNAAGGALMARAREAGQLRSDVPDADIIDLAASIAWIREHDPRDDGQVDRLLALVLDAITTPAHRAPGSSG